ncbi:MAG: hypothetical protein ACE5D2_05405 [Fidelibacterota bacterium]
MKALLKEYQPLTRDYRVSQFMLNHEKKLLDGCALPVLTIPIERILNNLMVATGKTSRIGQA